MLWLALALIVVAVMALVPWTVVLDFRSRGAVRPPTEKSGRLSAKVSWGCIGLGGDAAATRAPEGTPDTGAGAATSAKPARKSGGRRQGTRKVLALVRSKGFVASLVRLVRRLLRHLRPRDTSLSIRLGLGDPADTGRLWGALSPLVALLLALDNGTVMLAPDFARRCFEVQGRTTLRVIPGFVLLLVLGYLLSPPPWRAVVHFARA